MTPPPKGEARLGSPFGGRYVPVGRCPAAGLRCRVGRCWTSATGRQHPSRQARLAAERRACANHRCTCAPGAERSEIKVFCGTSAGRTRFLFKKASTLPLTLWARSQKGTRETAKRFSRTAAYREGGFPKAGLRASAPHNSVSPRRRLYQRAAHALGGVTGKLGATISAAPGGTEDPRRGSST